MVTACPRIVSSPRSDWPSQSYKVVLAIPSRKAASLVERELVSIAIAGRSPHCPARANALSRWQRTFFLPGISANRHRRRAEHNPWENRTKSANPLLAMNGHRILDILSIPLSPEASRRVRTNLVRTAAIGLSGIPRDGEVFTSDIF
jgi:hypothetical protein